MKRITVLVSDLPDGALHERARALFGRLADHYDVRIVCHEGGARRRIAHFFNTLQRTRPDLIYIVDPIYAAVAAARGYTWLHRTPVVLDTGASFTVVATDILVHLGYDPANPLFTRQLSARSARPTIDYKAAS